MRMVPQGRTIRRWSDPTPGTSAPGMTLVEVLMVLVIAVVALCGLLAALVVGFDLAETARHLSTVTHAAQQKLEEIRAHPVNRVASDYAPGGNPGDTFAVASPVGMGRVEITQPQPNLLQARIVVSWRQRGNRIVGEDRNLNGRLNPGEDRNGNGRMDAPCELVTYLTQR